jgi:hypothetical protein
MDIANPATTPTSVIRFVFSKNGVSLIREANVSYVATIDAYLRWSFIISIPVKRILKLRKRETVPSKP